MWYPARSPSNPETRQAYTRVLAGAFRYINCYFRTEGKRHASVSEREAADPEESSRAF